MKVLAINLFYKKGSTGKLVYEIHKGLIDNNIESAVCYALDELVDDEQIFKFGSNLSSKFYTYLSAITGMQYTYSFAETQKLINFIVNYKPDIVHVHVINCNTVNIYKLLQFLKDSGYKTMLTFHADYLYTGGCSHSLECNRWKTGCGECPRLWSGPHSLVFDRTHYFWNRFNEIYRDFSKLKIVCVSDWLKDRAAESPFFQNTEISVIENGIDVENTFYPQKHLNKKYQAITEGKIVLLHVTPSFKSKIKGGKYILELAQRLDKTKYLIVIVGYDGNDKLPDNIFPVSKTSDQNELAAWYSLANLTIITSQVETFSMVTVESLACGTPVVGFKCGAPEQIALKNFSKFVENGNVDQLENLVYDWTDKKTGTSEIIVKEARTRYSTSIMVNKYVESYKNFI